MILYTPMPPEAVFPSEAGAEMEMKTVETGSGVVTLYKNEQKEWIVHALQSSDPQDYLHPACQPGAIWNQSE
ncbi:YlzJ-like family protein [Salibacterium lacus]|uniref:YlzJ-like family protein n=1 Tax=Salibacterium lacus TaxID=1898109 RepID=A0ABW5SZP7_9BACI